MSQTASLKITLGGKANVHCVHDREKRQVVTEEQVVLLGLEIGVVFQKGIHHIFHCPCCDNLFVDDGAGARYCSDCRGPIVHALGGPLPDPEEGVPL